MSETDKIPQDEGLFPSVFIKTNWPYGSVEEEFRVKDFESRPYGPFRDWVYQLGLNINDGADYETCNILLCLLNYAATHDNKIEDTRDFLGFLWWYGERVKKFKEKENTEKRKAAYQALVYRIVEKTDYLSIDLFSPMGEIYSVSLLDRNAGIGDYMAVKLKLQRLYIEIIGDKDRDLLGYLDLREIDREFFETLGDREIYQAYVREFFLYELTPENIRELLANPKFAVIKVPTKQTVLMPPEFLSQLGRISFLKLSQVFCTPDGGMRNVELLNRIVDKANAKSETKRSPNFALELMQDPESPETEHAFWEAFLEGITSCTAQEVESAGSVQMYAFLMGAVLPPPESRDTAEDSTVAKMIKSSIDREDIRAFYIAVSEDITADYTFAKFLEIFQDLPFASKYRGMEKEFIEKALEDLIREGMVTKIREPNPKNISHFIVTRNLPTVFESDMEKIRTAVTAHLRKRLPADENGFRFELEKFVSSDYPVFYQLYVRKEFAEYIFRAIEKNHAADADRYRSRLFISGTKEPAFLPLPELLQISYHQLKIPVITEISETPAAASPEKTAKQEKAASVTIKEPDLSGRATEDQKPGITVAKKSEPPRAEKETVPPADFVEILLYIIAGIGKFLRRIFGGFKSAMIRSIEKDMERKQNAKQAREKSKPAESVYQRMKEAKAPQADVRKEIELSLNAIAKSLIEDFTGSGQLTMEEALRTLSELWNDPKTINEEEKQIVRKENLSRVNSIVMNNCQNLNSRNVTQAAVMERSAEIADYVEIENMIKILVPRKENKEIIKRYIALYLCAVLLK